MAYSRFSEESDVYLIKTGPEGHDLWECMQCRLDPEMDSWITDSLLDVREHLKAHEKAGHKVHPSATGRVEEELFKKETTDVAKAGGVMWQCADCKASGAIKKTSPFAGDVREKHGEKFTKLNDAGEYEICGVEFTKDDCPVCSEQAKTARKEEEDVLT